MLREVAVRGAIMCFALALLEPAPAHAAMLMPGFYALSNHPDGLIDPPPYGARLDELYDATIGLPDDFTFNFDYVSASFSSAMWLTVTETSPGRYTLTISGESWGGRDLGGVYANDIYEGVYEFFFEYVVGAKDHFNGDDDIVVDPMDFTDAQGAANTGWVKTPLGDTILLADDKDGAFSFRFGDEDDDLGHRGFSGISGWGWLKHGSTPPLVNEPLSDWIFTAEKSLVPTPGSVVMLAIASLFAFPSRRR